MYRKIRLFDLGDVWKHFSYTRSVFESYLLVHKVFVFFFSRFFSPFSSDDENGHKKMAVEFDLVMSVTIFEKFGFQASML